MYLAQPQPHHIGHAHAADTVGKFERLAAYDALYDECRAAEESTRASSPSSVYSERPITISASANTSTSPSSVYSTRPTTTSAPSTHHKHNLNGALPRHGHRRPVVPSTSILDANLDTALVSRRKMPNGKYQYHIRIPERASSRYALLAPSLEAFPAPPGLIGESTVRGLAPETMATKHALSEFDEQYIMRQHQMLLQWRRETWDEGAPVHEANAGAMRAKREVRMSNLWKEGKLRASWCEE